MKQKNGKKSGGKKNHHKSWKKNGCKIKSGLKKIWGKNKM